MIQIANSCRGCLLAASSHVYKIVQPGSRTYEKQPFLVDLTHKQIRWRSVWCSVWCMMLMALALFVLAACGSDNTPATELPPATALAMSAPTSNEAVIVAMGDSLTEGLGVDPDQAYPAQLERRLRADGHAVTVINAGVSGETSSGALARVDWVLRLKPQIVILATGGNDSLRGIDSELTRANIDKLVKRLQAEDAIVVLAGMQTMQNMGDAYTSAFQAIYPAIVQNNDNGVILIPFFLEGVGGKSELNQADSIHPTAEGYTVIVETIYPYVLEAIAQIKLK